jgi:hypothetical protein
VSFFRQIAGLLDASLSAAAWYRPVAVQLEAVILAATETGRIATW